MNTIVIAKRIIRQTIYDKRTLGLIIVAPLLILTLVYFIFDVNNNANVNIGVNNTSPAFNEQLKGKDVKITKYENDSNIKDKLVDDDLDAFISYGKDNYKVTYLNEDINITNKISSIMKFSLLNTSMEEITSKIKALPVGENISESQPKISESYIYMDKDADFFDSISPVLVSFFVFFFVFLISGIALLNERRAKTLERMLTTPTKRSSIVLGYMCGFGLIAIVQTAIIVCYAIYVLSMPLAGGIVDVMIINFIVALVALSLGTLVSTFAESEFQMMQFIPLVIIPQVFFSGLIPVNQMADWLQVLAHIFPLYYGAQALNGVMIRGEGLMDVIYPVLILVAYILIFTLLNMRLLKKYRKI